MDMAKDIVLFGGLLLDRYICIDRWPERGQDGFFEHEDIFVGGCAINMAVTIHNLGGHAHVVSCVGQDSAGQTILKYLEKYNLSQSLVYSTAGATGSCLVFLEPDGERTFLTRKGIEGNFPVNLSEKIKAAAPAWAGVTGYYLLGEDTPLILSCLKALHQNGTKILFDPSPLVGDIRPDILAQIVSIADILTPNVAELSALGGEDGLPELVAAGKTILLKQGAQGGTVYSSDATFNYSSVCCEAVDTTGAGDSFSGAILHAMANHYSLSQSIELAVRCAAQTVQLRGPHGFWNLEESKHA